MSEWSKSKPLEHADVSGFNLAKRALRGDNTYCINIDQIIWDNEKKRFYVVEYQKCNAEQTVTPWTSHPNRYWDFCKRKYKALWRITQALKGRLYVINYAEEGTEHGDKFLVIEVLGMAPEGITRDIKYPMEFEKFSEWFRGMNKRGAT